ncbi:response regulator [Anaeromassilibacillus senegalensis]|uniref:response regulator n=1 Tax=Anaeromassilibacillus senegalensis TaxID=1673717 RepID=UPI0006816188|nr:response regulator [Anaeromassilibacillus senegalensis]
MNIKRIGRFVVPVLLAAAFIAGGIFYITGVRDALWTKAVTDILETTTQGRHALDTYLEKDADALRQLSVELAEQDSRDAAAILDELRLHRSEETTYICVDLDAGSAYSVELKTGYPLDEEQLELFQSMGEQGIRRPFLDGHTGVWTIGMYKRFTFADGAQGYVQKMQPLSSVADRFSLSFYNDAGFSYVVDRAGNILIRSQHRNSNRTFQNLFDIIDLQNNDQQAVDSFRCALEEGKQGVARFQYQGEDYVFCYVPMERAADWYVVSIIPDQVIMEQANSILRQSQLLIVFILAGMLALAAVFHIYRDSTRRVLQAEETARRAAESANHAKSRFLSNMSHDIRTPMNAVIGMTKLASDHINEPEKVQEYLKNIRTSGQLLVGLINDILDLSKIESGKMTLNNDTVSLVDLMTELVSIVQPTVQQKRQVFNIRLHRVEHEKLCLDALRLNQILLNLLSNAMKFTPEGGGISVDVTESPSDREGYAHFTFRVADTGIGMKAEFLKDLFTSFVREQDSRVSRIEGSGLGMAITKMIVDLMEGSIQVESTPGAGTIFTVNLDFQVESTQPEQMLPPLRVLVADDDPLTLQSAAEMLQELGVEADTAENGADAVERAVAARRENRSYDLILLDWRMPGMDGGQAARTILNQVGSKTQVVIFSAYDWARIQQTALTDGVAGFIQKPFFKSTLNRCIRQYVLGEAAPDTTREAAASLSGRRILLAEDNLLNQQIAQELLEGFGAAVETVDNGRECVERFSHARPGYFDLILMDVHMPDLNGYEATREIRALPRPDAIEIPILAMTADAFSEDIAAAKEAGMNGHLAKPLDIPAMMHEIRKLLGS